jgi:periplasmic divalent cation tolerance protein
MAAPEFRVVLVTASSPEEGAKIAEALVGERLAACVNRVDGVTSVYWWQGKMERGTESLLVIKTRAELVARLTERVKALHTYTVPEVVSLAVDGGNPAYLDWLAAETA